MKVYVLFHETNSGSSDESDGYVEAVYATKELADAAKDKAIRGAVEDGAEVWWHPDNDEDQDGNDFWEHDWSVHEHEVLTELSKWRVAT